MSKRKEIFKDAGIYAVSSYIAQAFDVLNGILVRRFLGPANMGVWTFLQVIQNYAKHSSLGVTTATARDVPYFREKGDQGKVDDVKNLVFSFTLITSFLTSLVIAGIAVWNRNRYPKAIYYGLFVVAALLILQRIYNLFIVLLRAHKEFAFAGILNIISSVLGLFLTVVLTWRFQLNGFYVSMLLNYIAIILLVLAKTKYRFSWKMDLKGLWPLLSLGSAVLIADILKSVLVSIDRLITTKYLGFESLGVYSVALMADNYLYMIPNMFSVIFFPHFQEAFAKRDNPEDLEKYMWQPTLSVAYFFPVMIGFVWCSSDWFVPAFLPRYTSGINALKILTLGSLFFASTHFFSTFLVTVRKHWLLIPIYAVSIVFGFGINLLFVHFKWGIEGVALAESIISIFYFILISSVCLRKICSAGRLIQFYMKLAICAAYFTGCLLLLDRLTGGISQHFFKFVAEFLIFMLLMSPMLWRGNQETRLLTTAWHMLRDKFLKFTAKV